MNLSLRSRSTRRDARSVPAPLLEGSKLRGVAKDAFEAWFTSPDGPGFNGIVDKALAGEVWEMAKRHPTVPKHAPPEELHLDPTWTQLRETMHSWPVRSGQTAAWDVSFSVCCRRYSKKLLRTRKSSYVLLFVTLLLGAMCGALHGNDPARNDLVICLLYTSPSPRDLSTSRMPSSA